MNSQMSVSDAVVRRKSIRAFLDTPVEDKLIREVLSKSARAPSGGNVQPWRLYVLNGDRYTTFLFFRSVVDAIECPKISKPCLA